MSSLITIFITLVDILTCVTFSMGLTKNMCFVVLVGYFCEGLGKVNVTGPCSTGFYCTRGANSSIPTDGITGRGLNN